MKAILGLGVRGALLGAAALALTAAAAFAGSPRTVAGYGAGAGKVNNPRGVAVNRSNGDLYVADRSNFRIDRFDSGGRFLLAWGLGVADGSSEELQVCGPEAPSPTKRCFSSTLASNPGAIAPGAVAVDNSCLLHGPPLDEATSPTCAEFDPSEGDVFVADANNRRVTKFGPSGELRSLLGPDITFSGPGDTGSDETQTVTVEAAGGAFTLALRKPVPVGSSASKETTAAIPYDASAPTVQAALEALPSVAVGDLSVTGGPGDATGSSPYEVHFSGGAYAHNFVAQMDASSAGLLGPQNVTVAVTAPGGGPEVCEPGRGDVCKATAGGGTLPGTFVIPSSLAFDAEGRLWVGDRAADRVQRFNPDGAFVEEVALEGLPNVSDLALAASGDIYAVKADLTGGSEEGAHRFDSTGAFLGEVGVVPHDSDPGIYWKAIALDAAGSWYSADRPAPAAPAAIRRFNAAGGQTSQFGVGQPAGGNGPWGVALDDGGGERPPTLYVASGGGEDAAVQAFPIPDPGPLPDNQEATDILPTSATLKATLNPEGHPTHYSFQYGADASYGQEIPEGTLPASFEDADIEAPLTGLTPNTTYHFRVVATDEGDPQCEDEGAECTVYGPDTTFTTRTAVGIEAQWATDIAARSATLHAELDPLGAQNATWRVQYGTSSSYGHESASFELPPSFGSLSVAVALTGLQPATTYHYRFVAAGDQDGVTYEAPGPDRTFTTQLAGLGFSLPDDRAWEMVSPADKHGGRIAAPEAPQGGQVQAASNGEALAYLSYGSLEADPQGNRLIEQSSQLARRQAGGSWSTTDITAPHTAVTAFQSGSGLEYKLFSTNLERALMEPRDCTALSPLATERTPYLRENSSHVAYTPLVTAAPEPFGGSCASVLGLVSVQGATPDLSHIVLGSSVPLFAGGGPYEWEAGELRRLNFKPEDEGGGVLSAGLGSGEASMRGAVSEDGLRYFLTGVAEGGLYVRDTARNETLRLDQEQSGAFGTGEVEPLFQGASADGSVAFFTDTQNLTSDANEEGADLYRWREEGIGGCEAPGGCLDDLSAGVAGFGESAEVQGLLPGVGADGATAYLVARGVLDEEPNGGGEGAAPGQPNLYVWREGEGMRFVATLAEADQRDWGATETSKLKAFNLSAAPSPSGRYLAFMSRLPLTGYDNRDATSGEPAQEVFRYDSVTDELTCVSCEHSGARPHALVPGPEAGELPEEFDPNQLWGGVAVAAAAPEAMKLRLGGFSLYRPRYVQDDGRVFFNAADSLVAADSNGDGDVYEYEPTGVGSCSPSSGDAGTATVPGGCVSLISSGTAEGTSAFLDASEGARDVFFYSPAQLSVTDTDRELDVYDAREGGEPAILEPLAECQGEACQPPATPPETQTPASAAFRGPGNPPGPSRCTASARRAQKLSRRAKLARRHARRLAHNPAKRKAARRLNSRSQRLAHRARGMSKRAKRCRRAERRRSSR